MKNCPYCGKRLKPLKYNRWKVIERIHRYSYPHKPFSVHALLNSEGEIFGYVIEESEKQEGFTVYEGNATFAISIGRVHKTLKEAKSALRERSI